MDAGGVLRTEGRESALGWSSPQGQKPWFQIGHWNQRRLPTATCPGCGRPHRLGDIQSVRGTGSVRLVLPDAGILVVKWVWWRLNLLPAFPAEYPFLLLKGPPAQGRDFFPTPTTCLNPNSNVCLRTLIHFRRSGPCVGISHPAGTNRRPTQEEIEAAASIRGEGKRGSEALFRHKEAIEEAARKCDLPRSVLASSPPQVLLRYDRLFAWIQSALS